jgi:uncharacterized RDD family membrane protein YckC
VRRYAEQIYQTMQPNYSTFTDRLLAGLVDWLVIGIIYWVLSRLSFGNAGSVLVTWLYFAIMESSQAQGTFGKQVMGLVVTDLAGRGPISFWRAGARYLVRFFSYALFCIGVLLMFVTAQRQTLHDLVTSTLVLKRR